MAKIDCGQNTADTKQAIDSNLHALEIDVRDAVQNIIGQEDKLKLRLAQGNKVERRAYAAWQKLYNNLVSHLMENATIAGRESYNFRSYLEMTQDFVQRMLKVQAHPAALFDYANPYRILSASKLINGLLHLQKTRWGKKLNVWERAFLPTTVFAYRSDRFGYIYKYAQKAVNLKEDARTVASPYKAKFNRITANYIKNLENSLANIKNISPNYIFSNRVINSLDDIDETDPNILEEGIKDIYTKDKRTVTFFGTIEDEAGRRRHLVYDQSKGEKLELAGNLISKDTLNSALINKYAYELTNDIMHGQTRYVVWRDKVRDEHEDLIHYELRKMAFKKEDSVDEFKLGSRNSHFTTIRGGMKVNYIILKDTIRGKEERYSAYILSTELGGERVNYFDKRMPPESKRSIADLRNVDKSAFKDGFYRTQDYKTYGKIYSEERDDKKRLVKRKLSVAYKERGWNFSNLNAVYMNSQPDHTLISRPAERKDPRLAFANLWESVANMRALYDQIGKDLSKRAQEEEDSVNKWLAKGGTLYKTIAGTNKKAEVGTVLKVINELFDISNRVWADKNGNIHTPNSHFTRIQENFGPVRYDDPVVDEMLEEAITDMNTRLQEIDDPNSQEYKELETIKKEFELTFARRHEEYMQEEIKVLEAELDKGSPERKAGVIAERNVHMKHRAQWTDLARRKKGSDVHSEYLDTVYYSIQKNKLMTSMLETLNLIIKADPKNFPEDAYHWLINRTKVAFHNPTAFGGFYGTLDYSPSRLADFLNKFDRKRRWTPEASQRLLDWTKGFFGTSLLGYNVGLTNRTQIVNNVIGWGWKATTKSWKIVDGKDETFTKDMVDAVVDNAGTDEVTSMFMDVMAHGTDLTMKDAGLLAVPGFPFQIPTFAFRDFMLMLKNNRKGFVEKGIPVINKRLREIDNAHRGEQLRRIELKKAAIAEELDKRKISKIKFNMVFKTLEREEARIKDPEHKKSLRTLRELYLDLITTPKSENNRKRLEVKFKRLMADVTDKRMKRMIAWKLSWWWDSFAPAMFTMTEGERIMRKQAVVTVLLSAMESGTLGDYNWEETKPYAIKDKDTGQTRIVNVPEVLLSDAAIKLARNAVNNTMFGMSAIHLGEAFAGMGQHFFLYKAYPLQQMLHDWNIVKAWMAGGANGLENTHRLAKAAADAAKRAWRGIPFDPTDETLDTEALAVLRFIGMRVAMTVVSILLEQLTIFRNLFRTPLSKQFSYAIRGGENPLFAISFRLLVNGLIWSYLDDDDQFEGDMLEVGWDVIRLFFPVFLTLPLDQLARWVN